MSNAAQLDELKKYTYAVYILQALGFLLPLTALVGVVVNYVKDDEVRGSWLESHFRWQKATFWYGLLWAVLGTLTAWLMVGYAVLGILTLWLIYRIGRGWVCLVDGNEMYRNTSGETHER